MDDEPTKRTGRPRHQIDMKAVDTVTFRMIETLVSYGRFGGSNTEVALFIIRTWLKENEDYLKKAIAERDAPLGIIRPEPDSD
jgi:hypothetical protein